MKTFLLPALLLSIVFYACRKQPVVAVEPDDDVAFDYTPIPNGQLTATKIIGYVTKSDHTPVNGSVFNYNGQDVTIMGNGMFYTEPVVTDMFDSRGMAQVGTWDFLITSKTFPLTPSSANYIRVQMIGSESIGSVQNSFGGTFPFENGGSITYGINSFYRTPRGTSPGYFGPELVSSINLAYLNPESDEFALRLQAYLAADIEGNRWFLKNYGGILFRMDPNGVGSGMDFSGGATADLKLPIPESMLAEAPDSVSTWKLVDGKWTAAGTAKKDGNFYKTKLASATDHLLAIPVKGIYATIQVRTHDSATLTNTRVRIRLKERVIAESVTDADGNAICFVPSNEKLVAEVLPDEKVYSSDKYQTPINPVTKTHTVRVVVPGNISQLSTLSGNVFNCDGQPLVSGTAKILLSDNREYIIPVKDGKFASTAWLYGSPNSARVQITDNSDGTQGEISNIFLLMNEEQKLTFSTCSKSTYLYCNYSIDGTSYKLADDASLSSVFMTAVHAPEYGEVSFKTSNSNKGVNFTHWYAGTGYIASALPKNLLVNGVTYMVDNTKESKLAYSRFDPAINGFIEGWFSIYYLDDAGSSHNVKGNFRVKRMF